LERGSGNGAGGRGSGGNGSSGGTGSDGGGIDGIGSSGGGADSGGSAASGSIGGSTVNSGDVGCTGSVTIDTSGARLFLAARANVLRDASVVASYLDVSSVHRPLLGAVLLPLAGLFEKKIKRSPLEIIFNVWFPSFVLWRALGNVK
jgi:hypothetical protein